MNKAVSDKNQYYTEQLVERFLRYVAIPSQSDASVGRIPSSEGQLELAKLLQQELVSLGLSDVFIDENGVLTAYLKGDVDSAPKVGFIAHLDTVDVALSPVIKPKRVHFTGADILLNKDKDIWLRVSERPEIKNYLNDEILVTDGTSVLGADDKAAIAIIMTMLAEIKTNDISHGDIYVAFVPDEEIGLCGSKVLDLERFKVDFAYTIDSSEIGEVVYETFNAGGAQIEITGITAHPMSSKGVLVNPLLVATDLMRMFDSKDTPEHTDGKDGYFWFTEMDANVSKATLKMMIRDFDRESYQARKKYIEEAISLIKAKHKRAEIKYEIFDIYNNISDSLGDDRQSIDLIYQAMELLDIKAKTLAMRGGTDGSALSVRGVVTPNYFTGAHNFHSKNEFLPLSSFLKSFELTMKILELTTK